MRYAIQSGESCERELRVRNVSDGKTGPRMVSLTGPVLAVLDGIERVEDVPWVIRGKSDARLTGIFSHWQRIRKEAGLDDVRVHDLRHSFASRALALGESLPMIGKILGHTQIHTTARYAHLARDMVVTSVTKIGDSIEQDLGLRN